MTNIKKNSSEIIRDEHILAEYAYRGRIDAYDSTCERFLAFLCLCIFLCLLEFASRTKI